ncbi:MAG: UTP--glucose-1-phosphate uridylyltransferase [Ruminococcaceae bacterium]|nr:UTP--glucose-1-phosphate uridylyltransferase [Oscillospiraceae bacterium]
MKVKKAVIPAAGLGTRMLPETKTLPKEMLPIVDKPAIQYVVEEAVNSGIEEILILTNRSKTVMDDYFDYHPELEAKLRAAGREEDANMIRKVADMAHFTFIRQKETLGLGHAVLCAKRFVGNEPFAVLLGDDIMKNDVPITRQLINAAEKYNCSAMGGRHVPLKEIGKYCTTRYEAIPGEEKIFHLLEAIEKPRPEQVITDFAILGRYVFTPEIFDVLEHQSTGFNGEIQLTDAIDGLAKRSKVVAVNFEGRRFDTGSMTGYLETVLEYALESEKTGAWLKEYILKKAEEWK